MRDHRLSREADRDLKNIAIYGIENFGVSRSHRYRDRLKAHFQALASNPFRYPLVEHVRQDYRRSVCGQHSVYFRVDQDEVVIVRILRGQDPRTALPGFHS